MNTLLHHAYKFIEECSILRAANNQLIQIHTSLKELKNISRAQFVSSKYSKNLHHQIWKIISLVGLSNRHKQGNSRYAIYRIFQERTGLSTIWA